MGKHTEAQMRLAKDLPNPRIGECVVPHCRTLQPAKGQYFGMCFFHMRLLHHWCKKTGYQLRSDDQGWFGSMLWRSRDHMIEQYCDWLLQNVRGIPTNEAVVYDLDGNIVGTVVATSRMLIVATPIKRVLEKLGITKEV